MLRPHRGVSGDYGFLGTNGCMTHIARYYLVSFPTFFPKAHYTVAFAAVCFLYKCINNSENFLGFARIEPLDIFITLEPRSLAFNILP